MKSFAIFVVALIASAAASAVPQSEAVDPRQSERWISGAVASAVEQVSATIKELGYDPFVVGATAENYALPVPDLFSLSAYLEEALVVGASDIVINQVSYWVITSRATFDVSLPSIEVSIRNAGFQGTVLNREVSGIANGKLAIRDVGLRGEVRVNIGIISGISIRSLDLNFYLGAIESQVENLVVLGKNYAALVNTALNVVLYNAIVDSYGSINEMIEIIAWQVVNEIF